MQKITDIIRVETKVDQNGNKYKITHAIVTDKNGEDEQVTGWGEYKINDEVMVFFDDRFQKPKMRKLIDKP